MKKIALAALFALTMIFAVSCGEESSSYTFTITPTLSEIGSQGGELTFTLKTDLTWTTECSEGITTHPSSGSGDATIVVSVPSTTSDAEVQHVVKVNAKHNGIDLLGKFVITQHPSK